MRAGGAAKEKPGATLAGATEQRDYGRVYAFARLLQAPLVDVVLLLERFCSRIETAHELAEWNRALESTK
jgi:hypothetical protein